MAHWIIEDHGFGGQYYTCSNCKELWIDIFHYVGGEDYCPNCGEPIDIDENEYIKVTLGAVVKNIPEVKTYSDYVQEALIFPHTIGEITYYSKEELIKWVEDKQYE